MHDSLRRNPTICPSAMNKCNNSLNICFWNIHGWKSQIIDNKFYDSEFLDTISNNDIVGLAELHTSNEVDIPGFKLIKQKFREKFHKGPKISGGMAVFVKESLANYAETVTNDNEDSIWIKIKKNFNGEKEDIYIGTFYISPQHQRNKHKKDFFSIINEEINIFQKKGNVFIQGDFNARTGSNEDFIRHDKFDSDFGIKNDDDTHARNSEDYNTNPRGRELLDVCKSNDFLIINGRKSGDIFGKYTSHQWNGSSVVDYGITSIVFMEKVSSFIIGNYVPWLSDHCPLFTTISLLGTIPNVTHTEPELKNREPGYYWKLNSKEQFENILNSREIKGKMQYLQDFETTNLDTEIKNTLLDIAKTCKLKKTTKQNKNRPPPWFDKECVQTKSDIKHNVHLLQKDPNNPKIRQDIFLNKKALKNLVQKKKRQYKHSMLNEMSNSWGKKDQKEFWRKLEKLNPSKKQFEINIPQQKLINHFKSTLNSKRTVCIPPDSKDPGELDYNFTTEELEKASAILKPGKATGIDNLSNEMLACFIHQYPKLVLKLFNTVLDTNKAPGDWSFGIINPLFKKGPKDDPSNYRGISLLSCLGKLFMSMLNNRLKDFSKKHNILSETQLGFQPGNRTSDALLITHNLIRKYCHKNNSKIYSCFIDFSKAFDTIPRDTLFQKLLAYNIKGNFYNTIKNIYSNDTACVKIKDKISESFSINQGVRQGCILSPLLFNIFLADLPKLLDSNTNKVNLGARNINNLIWADDILLFSETEEGLQEMLHSLVTYCDTNELTINTDKTKCMIFNKTGRLIHKRFFYKDIELETVRSYKYLGFLLTPSGEISSGLNDLRDRALKAFMKLKNTMGALFFKNVQITLYLYDSLIKPIILYASDFWGCLKLPKDNPIDKLQQQIFKQLLRVQKQTTNIGVLLELGRVPAHFLAIKAATKNWERIKHNEVSILLESSYTDAIGNNLTWITTIKNLLESNGMLCFFSNSYIEKPPFIHKILFQRLSDIFHQGAFHSITDENAKLRSYGLIKDEIGIESYLTAISNTTTRSTLTKFRLSNHQLMIEVGRHKKIPKHLRFCPFCPTIVETEKHFLINCPTYQLLREKLFQQALRHKPCFIHYTETQKYQYLLSNENLEITPKFIQNCFEIRELLISQPKRLS